MVSSYSGIRMYVIFDRVWNNGYDRRSPVFGTLARYNIIIRNSHQTKKNDMNLGFFIAGGVIFALYMGFTFWNILESNRKQKKENIDKER